jgi:vancomycin resistance protein YoaR
LVVAFDYSLFFGKVHKFVKVENLDLSTLSKDEFIEILQNKEKKSLEREIRFLFEDKSWKRKAKDLDFKFDIEETYKSAYELGRSGNLFKDIIERINLWLNGKNIPIVEKISPVLTSKFINEIESDVKREPVSSDIFIKNLQVIITPSKLGIELDKKLLESFIENSIIYKGGGTFDLPVIFVEPLLNESKLKNVKDEVEIIISGSITIKFGDEDYELSREKIAEMVEFIKLIIINDGNEEIIVDISFSNKSVINLLEILSAKIEKFPIDAKFIAEDEKVVIQPSVDGIKLNKNEFNFLLNENAHKKENRSFEVPTLILKPKLTTEKADSMGINELVSTHIEYFSPKALNRVHNIRLITSILDGILIAPDEIFSFNRATGERTKEKGFMEAPTIIQGELVDTFGGGVCNVSTTIFNTAFLGGYKIVERNPHQWYISRYQPGRDATVSWDVQDFKFQNDTNYWILIKGESTKSSCKISFYSTDIGREVKIETTPFSNFKTHGVKYKPDPKVPKGVEVVDSEGVDGRDVYVTRIISKNGENVSKENIFTRYYPKNKIILLNPDDYHEFMLQNQ